MSKPPKTPDIPDQYFQCHMTQPLLLEELQELDIEISSGQINRILIEGHDDFNAEKDNILKTGLNISSYINVDDTGARHKGINGVCTHIGNNLFAWFESTESKSRINFLQLPGAGKSEYILIPEAFEYMKLQKLPVSTIQLLKQRKQKIYISQKDWSNT